MKPEHAIEAIHGGSILARPSMRRGRMGDTTVEAFSVLACLAEIEALVKASWSPSIRLDVRASPDLPLATCSRMDLQNAIMNLLFNARDAMPGGGHISLDAAVVYEGPIARQLELRITDNGFGMTADTLLRAADLGFTTKTTGLGGLGLPMVARFAEEADGRLFIESEPGVGTIVILRLPVPGLGPSTNELRQPTEDTIIQRFA